MLQIVINNVNVRRGLLMLVPEVIEVLGGRVQVLTEAQERLIHEINKPPRGRRYFGDGMNHLQLWGHILLYSIV